MVVDGFSNAYSTTLNGAINNSVTSLVVTSATGAPATVPFRLRIFKEGSNTTEIVTVTTVAGTTYTITRASEAYAGVQSASAHASGATVEHVLTASSILTIYDSWIFDIDMFGGSHGATNWSTYNQDSGEFYGGDLESSGAQNDAIFWYVALPAGTYDIIVIHFKGNNRGIYSVQVDDVAQGTIDGYNASAVRNTKSTISSVTISQGKRKIGLKMLTKNGSSANYFGTVQHIQLLRTA